MALTTSTTNTTQATDDGYVYTESEWLASGMVTETTEADTTTTVLTLDVMANDSGGNAKTLYSIEASEEFTQGLLSSDVGGAPEQLLDEQGNYTGIQVWIENGKIMVDVTDALAALGAGSLDEMSKGEVIDHTFTYTIRLGNGTLSDATVHFSITGEGESVNMASVIGGDLSGSGAETDEPLLLTGQLTLTDEGSTDTEFVTGSQAGQYGTFTLDGTGQWTFQAYSAYDALATGEPLSESFLVQASDGSTQQVTVTITGTNDPVLPLSGTATGAIAENEDGPGFTRTGTVVFSDLDLSQVYEVGQIIVPDGAVGTLDVEVSQDGALHTFTWTYEVSQAAVEGLGLAQDETRELQFTVPVRTSEADDSGGLFPVTITLTGTNDGVSITGGDFTGEVLVRATVDGVQTGTIHFADADFTDVHTASFESLVDPLELPLGTFALFSLSEQPDTAAGSVGWTYTPDAQAIAGHGLMAGDTRTETYRITLTNPHGEPVSQDVTITIAGTDHPVELISGLDPETNAMLGALTEPAGPTDPDEVEGDLVLRDADVDQAYFLLAGTVQGAWGTLEASIVQDAEDPSIRTVHWTYTADPDKVDALAAGQTETEVLVLRIDDGLGRVAPVPVVITLTGTNDGPVAVVDTASTGEHEALTLDVLANDTDVDQGHVLTLTSVSVAPGQGSVSIIANSLSFDPGTDFNHLAAGDTEDVVLSYTIADEQGASSSSVVTVTVTGLNDAATIAAPGAIQPVVEDSGLFNPQAYVRSGTLEITDPDSGEEAFQAPVGTLTRTYGIFTFDQATGAWTYTLDNTAAQGLGSSSSAYETLTVTSLDGTATQDITVKVIGADEPQAARGNQQAFIAVLQSTDNPDPLTQSIAEDSQGILTFGGIIVIDGDGPPQAGFRYTVPVSGQYGSFYYDSTSKVWTYALDARAQALTSGQIGTDAIPITTIDGSASVTLTVQVIGADDTRVITGTVTGSLVEDGATATTGGTLTVSDGSSLALPASLQGTYGSYSLDPSTGAWSYTVDTSKVQFLAVGQTRVDKLNVTSADGTAVATLSVTLTGVNDAITTVAASTDLVGQISESGTANSAGRLTESGKLVFTDADLTDIQQMTFMRASAGAWGTVTLSATGGSGGGSVQWNYAVNASTLNVLQDGETKVETFTFMLTDNRGSSTEHTVAITLTGTQDLPVITGTSSAALSEDGATSTAAGSLDISDLDGGQSFFNGPASLAGTYGTFTFHGATGTWGFTLDNAATAVQALHAGQVVTDTITVTSADGTSGTDIVVTVTGADDPFAFDTSGPVEVGVLDPIEFDPSQAPVVETGTITFTDVDLGDQYFIQSASPSFGALGTFTANLVANPAGGSGGGEVQWTYTVDPGLLHAMPAGATHTDTLTLVLEDAQGNTIQKDVVVVLKGTQDVAVITASATDDRQIVLGQDHFAEGVLSIMDLDVDQEAFLEPASLTGTYGAFSFDPATGAWDYRPYESTLAMREDAQDSLTVMSKDGQSAHTITVDITGTGVAFADKLVNTAVGSTLTLSTAVLLANDTGPESLAIASVSLVESSPSPLGAISLDNGMVTLTLGDSTEPESSFSREFTFEYALSNGSTATVLVEVPTTSDLADTAYVFDGTADVHHIFVDLGAGDDVFSLGEQSPSTMVLGGSGNDTISVFDGATTLDGGDGDDVLIGGTGADTLWGRDGSDWLEGGDGDDVLYGGTGSDVLNGGSGSDTFVFDSLDAVDQLLFFESVDLIALSSAAFTTLSPGHTPLIGYYRDLSEYTATLGKSTGLAYMEGTETLYYVTGSQADGYTATAFAVFSTNLSTPTVDNFVVI